MRSHWKYLRKPRTGEIMTKLQRFRQAMKLQKLADKHRFENCFSPPSYETYNDWKSEGVAKRIKKNLGKGTGPMLVAC